MSDEHGAISPVSSGKKKDRGASSVGKSKEKKIDFVVLGMVFVTLLVVFGAVYFLLARDRSKSPKVEVNNAIDKAIVIRDLGSEQDRIAREMQNRTRQWQKDEQDKMKAEKVAREEAAREEEEKRRQQQESEDKKTGDEKKQTRNSLPPPNIDTAQDSNTPTPYQRKLMSSVMPTVKTSESAPLPSENTNSSLDSKSFSPGYATTVWRNKRDLLLAHGTNIPCALRTEIISTYSGLVTCSVISDVYSADGSTLLVEKGAEAFGTQSIALEQGQASVFVTWSDIRTQEGVSIKIDSLGTGALGASGVEAWVDTHFKERFGGAIMLSFLDDAFATMANSQLKNASVSTDNTQSMASDMASKALENSINIPPTGYVPIGTRLNILVARDVDMSNVYKLK